MVESKLTPEVILQLLLQYPQPGHYWLAFSGGMDSHVLLKLFSEIRTELAAGITAVHVNHGLHKDADHWQTHCERTCAGLEIEIMTEKVNASDSGRESPEAWARQLRYGEFAKLMQDDDVIVTAHHRDDQAETLLLQLFRGAGPAGLAGMPAIKPFGPGRQLRPLLEYSRAELRQYAESQELDWIDDDSNRDLEIDRNFVRHSVMPLLQDRWPSIANLLCRSALHQASASHLLNALAEMDYSLALCDENDRIRIGPLKDLDNDRVVNCLRYWLDLNRAPVPSTAHMERLVNDVMLGREDSMACVNWAGVQVRKHKGELHLMKQMDEHDPAQRLKWSIIEPLHFPIGYIMAKKQTGQGIREDVINDQQVEIRFRQGGEKIKPAGHRHTRDLKKYFQEISIEPWLRDRVPLIYIEDQLVAVADCCVAEGFEASDDESGWVVVWQHK